MRCSGSGLILEARNGGSLWVWEEEVSAQVDDVSAGKRRRNLDLNAIPCDIRREDAEAPLPLFCPDFLLDPWMLRGREFTAGL